MASPNVELVQSIFAAWERGDFSSTEWAHPDVEFVLAEGPHPGAWTGRAGLIEGFRGFVSAWKDLRVEAEEFRELDGERVLVLVRLHGRGKASGMDLEQMRAEAADLFHLRGGKVTKLVVYNDAARAVAAVGLPSEAGSS